MTSPCGEKCSRGANFCKNLLKSNSNVENACLNYVESYVKRKGYRSRPRWEATLYSKCVNKCNQTVQKAGFSLAGISLAQTLPVLCLLILMIGLGIRYKRSNQRTANTAQESSNDRRHDVLLTSYNTV